MYNFNVFCQKERKIKTCCKEPPRTSSDWHPICAGGAAGTVGEMPHPCKRSPWQGGDGTQPVLGSPVTRDGVGWGVPQRRHRGHSPARPALASLWSPGRVRGCEGERQGACLERAVTLGGAVARAWLLPDMQAEGHWGAGGTGGGLGPGARRGTGANRAEEAESIVVTFYSRINAREHQPVNGRAWKTCWDAGLWGIPTARPSLHASALEMSSGFRCCCLVQSSWVSCRAKMLKSGLIFFCRRAG